VSSSIPQIQIRSQSGAYGRRQRVHLREPQIFQQFDTGLHLDRCRPERRVEAHRGLAPALQYRVLFQESLEKHVRVLKLVYAAFVNRVLKIVERRRFPQVLLSFGSEGFQLSEFVVEQNRRFLDEELGFASHDGI